MKHQFFFVPISLTYAHELAAPSLRRPFRDPIKILDERLAHVGIDPLRNGLFSVPFYPPSILHTASHETPDLNALQLSNGPSIADKTNLLNVYLPKAHLPQSDLAKAASGKAGQGKAGQEKAHLLGKPYQFPIADLSLHGKSDEWSRARTPSGGSSVAFGSSSKSLIKPNSDEAPDMSINGASETDNLSPSNDTESSAIENSATEDSDGSYATATIASAVALPIVAGAGLGFVYTNRKTKAAVAGRTLPSVDDLDDASILESDDDEDLLPPKYETGFEQELWGDPQQPRTSSLGMDTLKPPQIPDSTFAPQRRLDAQGSGIFESGGWR